MKTKKFQKLTRTEMKEVMAGNRPELSDGGATVRCVDGTDRSVSSCTEPEMTNKCAKHGGDWTICSGGS